MGNALEIKNLTKKFNDFQLDNVSLTLPEGCIMGFIGENGAGKSTTIKLILDLLHRDGGDISVLGKDFRKSGAGLREEIGVVMDESNFPANLSLKDVNSIMKNCYKTWNSEKFLALAHQFNLPHKKTVKDYSRGMKMKLSIAVALSHASRLLILDEATSGLDPIVRDEILDVFLEFIQDEKNSIFISSHIISDLEKICDYITFLHKGKIIFSETKEDLLEKYVIVKCTKDQYETIDKSTVIGARKNSFGVEALMERSASCKGFVSDQPTIEDIMLYFVKEDQR